MGKTFIGRPSSAAGWLVLLFFALPVAAQLQGARPAHSALTDVGLLYLLPAVLAAYYFVAWFFLGREPSYLGVPVQYRAPEGLSPGAVAFVYTLGECDGRTYAAILASLAARGAMTFTPREGHVYMEAPPHRIQGVDMDLPPRPPNDAPEEERIVFKEVFEWERAVKLEPPEKFSNLLEHLQAALKKRLGNCFTRNLPWVIAGLAITAACTVGLALALNLDLAITLYVALVMVVWGFGSSLYWQRMERAVKLAVRGLYRRRTLPLTLGMGFLAPVFWFGFFTLAGGMNPLFTNVTSLLLLINTFGPPALRNYTARGRKLRQEIEGFRRFVASTEQDRLNRLNPPDQKPEVDLEYLPYAIALDLRERFGDRLGIDAMVETVL